MTRQQMEYFLARLTELRVMVIGDLMLDEYLWGGAERISPEAPVPVVNVQRDDLRLGGAGNVVHNLIALGCKVSVASVLGGDSDGALLQQQLVETGADTKCVLIEPGRVTSRKTRVLANNQQMLRIDRESSEPVHTESENVLIAKVIEKIEEIDVILVSDYLKGVLTKRLLAELISIGKNRGIPVIIDPKGDDYSKYHGATLLTPNRKEAQTAARIKIHDESSLQKAGERLLSELRLEALLITRSEEGMSLFSQGGRCQNLPTEAREVFDVSGAGDTVLAMMGAGLAAGLEIEVAATIANLAAGIVVGKVGTSTVTAEELLFAAWCSQGAPEFKIHEREMLARILEQERMAGRTIVFTNGCFDLLHVGHVKYLQKARQLGDLLVLGLNSDSSIKRLKGEKRPLICEEERAHILAALDCIDYLTIFDEDTPLDLITVVRPDVLVKGADYSLEGVVGRDLVESWGGRVELVGFVDGKSTTSTIEKILEQHRD